MLSCLMFQVELTFNWAAIFFFVVEIWGRTSETGYSSRLENSGAVSGGLSETSHNRNVIAVAARAEISDFEHHNAPSTQDAGRMRRRVERSRGRALNINDKRTRKKFRPAFIMCG